MNALARSSVGVRLRRFVNPTELALWPALAACVVIGALVSDAFLTYENFLNILQQSTVLALLVLAASLVLLGGKFDLSIESTLGFAAMVGCWAVVGPESTAENISPALGIAIMLAVGAAVGAFNGLLIVGWRLNAFIVTLAMLVLLRGLTVGVNSGATLYDLPPAITWLGSATLFAVPVSVFLVLAVYAVVSMVMRHYSIGRSIYALGGNERAARAAGIPTRKILFGLFVVAGVLAAVAGLVDTGRVGAVTSSQGQNLIFNVMAAAVIGGISLNGGRGTITGAMTGVLLLGTIDNILALAQVPPFWIQAIYGAVILIALGIARVTSGEAQE